MSVNITKQKFDSYRVLQRSGFCNMMDVKSALFWLKNPNGIIDDEIPSGDIVSLTEDEYKEILFNYSKYWGKYVKVC